jgi:hypothetical protein
MSFDGDAINYASFMHNFETCLEKDNPDNSTITATIKPVMQLRAV